MIRTHIITGAVFGVIGVVLGAIATHALSPIMPERNMMSFKTGITYQMYHAMVILFLPALFPYLKQNLRKVIFGLQLFGVLFFSGSIYLLNLSPILKLDASFLGPITPIGGLLLITSWIMIAISAVLKKKD